MEHYPSESGELDPKVLRLQDFKDTLFLQPYKSRFGIPVSFKDIQPMDALPVLPDPSYLTDASVRLRKKRLKTFLGEKSYMIMLGHKSYPPNHIEGQILLEGGYIDLMGSIFRTFVLRNKLMLQKTSAFSPHQYCFANPLCFTNGKMASIELQFYKQALLTYLHACYCSDCCCCQHPICLRFISMVLHIKKCPHNTECHHPFCLFGRFVIFHCSFCVSSECCFCQTVPPSVVELCKVQLRTNSRLLSSLNELAVLEKSSQVENKNSDFNLNLLKVFQQSLLAFTNEVVDPTVKPSVCVDRQKYINDILGIVSAEKCMDFSDSFIEDPVLTAHLGFYERFIHSRASSRDTYVQSLQLASTCFEFLYKILLDIRLEETDSLLSMMSVDQANPGLPRDLSYGFQGTTEFAASEKFPPALISEQFLPIIRDLLKSPDSYPFHLPVDPYLFDIPDYYSIVKYPMDFSVVIARLEANFYLDPWEVIHDVSQMFSNAWVYNRKNSKIYKMTTRLYEAFNEAVEALKEKFQLCCTKRKLFVPQQLFCIGKDYCVIHRDQLFYQHLNYYIYCESCFKAIKGDTVEVATDDDSVPDRKLRFSKTLFKKYKNTSISMEPFVTCSTCRTKFHQLCVLYFPEIQGSDYVCNTCIQDRKHGYLKNYYVSKRLPSTASSDHIERMVNGMLRDNGCNNHVTIRLVCNDKKFMDIKEVIINRFHKSWPRSMSYQSKTYYAFETLPCGNEICFFGLHVQEYGDHCPEVNRGRVYLSYLDSVHFFQPRELRTSVYFHIILGYFDYCRLRNFTHVHIWSCPPCENDDYIFHCHPLDQKVPNHTRLAEWYQNLLKLGIEKKIFRDVEPLQSYINSKFEGDLRKIPYFDGDYWPNAIEDTLNEFRNEGNFSALDNIISNAFFGVSADVAYPSLSSLENRDSSRKGKRGRRPSKCEKRGKKGKDGVDEAETVEQKLEELMERFKDSFFVGVLNNEGEELKIDEDKLIHSELTDGRSGLLQLCREKKYEFSTLQRTMFATIGILIELHTQFGDRVVYTCNNCKCHLFKKYHCMTCPDFDLCVRCYVEVAHEHEMEKQKDDPDRLIKSLEQTCMNRLLETKVAVSEEAVRSKEESSDKVSKMEAVYSHQIGNEVVESLVHASVCPRTGSNDCPLDPRCYGIKLSVAHFISCPNRGSHSCYICRSIMLVAFQHAKMCKNPRCHVFFCRDIQGSTRKVSKFRPAIPNRHKGGSDARRRMQSMMNQRKDANSPYDENSNSTETNLESVNPVARGSSAVSNVRQVPVKEFPVAPESGSQMMCVLSQTGHPQRYLRLDVISIRTCKFIDPLFFLIDPAFNTHVFPDDIVFYNIAKINITLVQNMDEARIKISIYYLRKYPGQLSLLPPQQKRLALNYMANLSGNREVRENTEVPTEGRDLT